MENASYYGKYAGIRNNAWGIQIDFDISGLPVKLSEITKQMGISVIRNSHMNILDSGEYGRSYLIDEK